MFLSFFFFLFKFQIMMLIERVTDDGR